MNWLFNIFKPKIQNKPESKISMCRFGMVDIKTEEYSDGYITSNGKMAFRRVGKWSRINNKLMN